MGHGFSFVKEALVDDAGCLQRAGYVVLTVDYRTFGESEGEPRGQLFLLNESEDYRNALSYLETRDEVDPARIGIWGTSFGGAIVIYTGAIDRRAKAVVAQVPVVNGRRWMSALRTSDLWLELLDKKAVAIALRSAPALRVSREPLIRAVAYRIQEQAFGGLKPSTRRLLARLAHDARSGSPLKLSPRAPASAGTVLMREWQGITHEVRVLDRGVLYKEKALSLPL